MASFRRRNTNRARELRNQATPAEHELWKYLSKRQVAEKKFSRQMPVGPYYADFLCRELNLIIEVDGYSHDTRQQYDKFRTKDLADHGYREIRFTNDDVLNNVEGVVAEIERAIADMPTPNPSRKREGNS